MPRPTHGDELTLDVHEESHPVSVDEFPIWSQNVVAVTFKTKLRVHQ